MSSILLDTNAYTALLMGDKEVLSHVVTAETVFMSVFVLGELYAGFKGGTKEKANRKTLSEFLKKPTVKKLFATTETAEYFGQIKHQLRKSSTPLPINDVWIAAHAMQTGSALITFDRHFEKVHGVRLGR